MLRRSRNHKTSLALPNQNLRAHYSKLLLRKYSAYIYPRSIVGLGWPFDRLLHRGTLIGKRFSPKTALAVGLYTGRISRSSLQL